MNPAKTPKPSPYFIDFKIFWLIETGGGASSTMTVAIALISSACISRGNSSTITNIWDIQIAHYNENGKIFKVEDRIDTLHLAEGNVGPRI